MSNTHRLRVIACASGSLALALIACGHSDRLQPIRAKQEAGDFEATIEPLRDLLADHPDDAEANYLYGRALVSTDHAGLASWALRRAMKDPAWEIAAGLQLATASLSVGDYNETVEIATHVLEREPENVPALLARSEANAYWRKDLAQALADANRAAELDPDAIEVFKPRILALLSLEKTDEARAAIEELGRRIDEIDSPETTRAWYCATSAVFAHESGQRERASQKWDECLAAFPSSPEVIRPALDYCDATRQPGRAIEILRKAVAEKPDDMPYRAMLADRLRQLDHAADAEALLLEATRNEDPHTASQAWLATGKLRQAIGNPEGGADAIEQSLAIARKAGAVTPQLSFEYADALVLAKRFDRALEVADDLTVPAHQHLIRARVAQERGDPAHALEEFSAGFQLWPDNPWARYYAARAAEDIGDFERAAEEYRTSIRIDPGATDARTRIARLLLADHQPRAASQLLRELDHKSLEAAGELLALRVAGHFGTPEQIDEAMKGQKTEDGRLTAEAVAEIANGAAEGKSGPKGAVRALRRASDLDFAEPRDAAALRALVRIAHKAGERGTPRELKAALAARPQAAVFQEISGLDQELAGNAEAARAAYARALEGNSNDAHSLAGLGRLAAQGDPAQALGYFDRAAAADPSDPEAKLGAARALLAMGKIDDAAARLDELLAQHPFESDAAALRASLDLDRGVATDRTLERAVRAARFGGGPDALDLLGRVYAKRGDTEQAARAADRARTLREKGPSKSPTSEESEGHSPG